MTLRAFLPALSVLATSACNRGDVTSLAEAEPGSAEPGSAQSFNPARRNAAGARANSSLLRLAREVGAYVPEPAAPALTGPVSYASRDPMTYLGAEVAPRAPGDVGTDAGAPPLTDPVADAGSFAGGDASGDAAAEVPEEPPDIVAESALPIYGLEAGERLSERELWDRVAKSSAVCFGEFHDIPAHHYAETRALTELAARARARRKELGLGFEMFQRPFQAPLSAFVAGELSEEELIVQTEYGARWGYDFAFYRPLLEGARELGLPALALNARSELTRKIGRGGLEALTEAELAELPELDLTNAEHRAFIFGLFGVLPEHAAELGLEPVYTAQTVWDETMADTSARWLIDTGRAGRLLIFAGVYHCHRSAIPTRITRRTMRPAASLRAVFQSELDDGSVTPEGYDILVVLEDI